MPARHTHGGGFKPVPSGAMAWQPLKVGGAGHFTGMSLGYDGTLTIAVRTDVGGGYIWNPSSTNPTANDGTVGAWEQIFAAKNFGLNVNNPVPNPYYNKFSGISELQVYPGTNPGDANIMYMLTYAEPSENSSGTLLLTVWKTTNKGSSWSQCSGFTPFSFLGSYSNSTYRLAGLPRMSIHPTNSNIMYIGTGNDSEFGGSTNYGLWVTLDGGTSFTRMDGAGNPLPTGTA